MNRVLHLGVLMGLSLSLGHGPLPLLAASRIGGEAPSVHGERLQARGGRGGAGSRGSSGRTGFGSYSNGGSAFRGSSTPAGGFSR